MLHQKFKNELEEEGKLMSVLCFYFCWQTSWRRWHWHQQKQMRRAQKKKQAYSSSAVYLIDLGKSFAFAFDRKKRYQKTVQSCRVQKKITFPLVRMSLIYSTEIRLLKKTQTIIRCLFLTNTNIFSHLLYLEFFSLLNVSKLFVSLSS